MGAEGTGDEQGTGMTIAARLVAGYEDRDLESLGQALATDARWGAEDDPWRCRNRDEILSRLGRFLDRGTQVRVTELVEGRGGIVCRLTITWPRSTPEGTDPNIYLAYLIDDGLITELQEHEERADALAAIR